MFETVYCRIARPYLINIYEGMLYYLNNYRLKIDTQMNIGILLNCL